MREADALIKKMVPEVAVCLAAFNGIHWLSEQLDSILDQTLVVVTVFISVDASTDGTEAWVDARAQLDNRLVILPHGKRFGGASRNFFRILRDVDLSKFDYVSFADQDDIWLPNKLSRAHTELLVTNADAYSSNVTAFWPNGRQVLIKKSQPQVHWDFLFEAAGPGCTYVMKKELVCAVKGVLKNHWDAMQDVGQGQHDWFIYAFARANGYVWLIDDFSGMLYRQHEQNQVGVNLGWRAFLYRIRMVMTGWGLAQAAIIAQLVGLDDDAFVARWVGGGKLGLLWLALHSYQCRRRLRDKLLFALCCLVLCLIKRR
jgi:rhamnosyltransferase